MASPSAYNVVLLKMNETFIPKHLKIFIKLTKTISLLAKRKLVSQGTKTHPEDKALPCAKEAQFVASSLPFLPIRGEESATNLRQERC